MRSFSLNNFFLMILIPLTFASQVLPINLQSSPGATGANLLGNAGQSTLDAPQDSSGPAVTLWAASQDTISFYTQNGRTIQDRPSQSLELPRLVLYRNGALTPAAERTLNIKVSGLQVPSPGVTVTLSIETQHGDPDQGGGQSGRIQLWRESQWVSNSAVETSDMLSITFTHEFTAATTIAGETIPTPTDYFSYEVTVSHPDYASTEPLYTFDAEYAFLMESQWVVALPEVNETTDGAAPDELVVYYCDMFPFQIDSFDHSSWLARAMVDNYLSTELLPAMIEAFLTESDGWDFPWSTAWTGYRNDDDPGRMSVALSDGQTWFHGVAPSYGHAGISIKVKAGYGENADYANLTEKVLGIFYHELFHNLQRNIAQQVSGNGDVSGKDNAWEFFSEGTAVLASSVGQPDLVFSRAAGARDYLSLANSFILEDLQKSYAEINPYHAALYWRFLYEQCGGLENPTQGMQIIRQALEILYSGEIVNIQVSNNLQEGLPRVMDQVLATSTCPFQSYAESLSIFSRAVYSLRVVDGRCSTPGTPAGCGLYDPDQRYAAPVVSTISFSGEAQSYTGHISTSFGMDFVEVALDESVELGSLTIQFSNAADARARFSMQILKLTGTNDPQDAPDISGILVASETLTTIQAGDDLVYEISEIDTDQFNRLALIITRVDSEESQDSKGEYKLFLQ